MNRHTKIILLGAAVIGALLVAGIAGMTPQAEEPASYRPNDRANHHPADPNG